MIRLNLDDVLREEVKTNVKRKGARGLRPVPLYQIRKNKARGNVFVISHQSSCLTTLAFRKNELDAACGRYKKEQVRNLQLVPDGM